MKIKEIKTKSIIVKSNLPDGDFVINPYIGCMHGCKYCYARFMKRFTGHTEPLGSFVDIKINAPDLIPEGTNKYREKSIIISSVTDPYQPIEREYKITRKSSGIQFKKKNLAFSARWRDFLFKNCYFLFVLSIEIL